MRLLTKDALNLPAPRGPLLSPEVIAKDPELFNGRVSPKWVRANCPNKVKLGHSTVAFYRDDVLAFIASRRRGSAA